MRFAHRDGTRVHLAYCTNVHPSHDVDTLFAQVRDFGGGIRARLGVPRLGLGLWLPAPVAAHLADHPDLDRLRYALDANGLEVVTLNAFPYQGFHDPVVKKSVYRPDWVDTRRLDYTLDCARVLARLMPDDAVRGSISTLPLAWRTPWGPDRRARAGELLDRLATGLAKLEADTGRRMRVGLEPEPGCVIETVNDAIDVLKGALTGIDTERIGICLDACHLAVAFDDPAESVRRLTEAGLPIVKTQASVALHASAPDDPATRQALAQYTEDRFLHQVREHGQDRERGQDRTAARDDLPDALTGGRALPGSEPWRIHFHVPLHERPQAPLDSTQEQLAATLNALFGGPEALTDHVEVETYTWSVLPARHRPTNDDELAGGLAAELRWAADALRKTGLEPAE